MRAMHAPRTAEVRHPLTGNHQRHLGQTAPRRRIAERPQAVRSTDAGQNGDVGIRHLRPDHLAAMVDGLEAIDGQAVDARAARREHVAQRLARRFVANDDDALSVDRAELGQGQQRLGTETVFGHRRGRMPGGFQCRRRGRTDGGRAGPSFGSRGFGQGHCIGAGENPPIRVRRRLQLRLAFLVTAHGLNREQGQADGAPAFLLRAPRQCTRLMPGPGDQQTDAHASIPMSARMARAPWSSRRSASATPAVAASAAAASIWSRTS